MTNGAVVGDILQEYAGRGVFRGFSRHESTVSARILTLWHRNQLLEWGWNDTRQTLRISCVLPAVPAGSAMYREFKAWLRARQDDALPEHRRCDRHRVALKTYNRGGDVALSCHILDGDVAYGVHKLVSLVNEIYLDFLSSGLYLDWQVETFGLDPDQPY